MPIAVSCPTCGARFSVADELYKRRFAGRIVTVRCRHCQTAIRFDASEPPAHAQPEAEPKPEPPPVPAERFVPRRPPSPPRPPQPARARVVALSPGLLDVPEPAPSEPPPTPSSEVDEVGEVDEIDEDERPTPRNVEAFLVGLRGDSQLTAALASPALPTFDDASTPTKSAAPSPVSRSGAPSTSQVRRRGPALLFALGALGALGIAAIITLTSRRHVDEPRATATAASAALPAALHQREVTLAPSAPEPAPGLAASVAPPSPSGTPLSKPSDAGGAASPLTSLAGATSTSTSTSPRRAVAQTPGAAASAPSSELAAPPRDTGAGTEPMNEPEPTPVTEPFDRSAAAAALAAAAQQASSCRKDGDPSGTASTTVIFAPSGRVTSATLSGPPFAGTQTGGCIAASLRRARIPAFAGESVTVSKTVLIR